MGYQGPRRISHVIHMLIRHFHAFHYLALLIPMHSSPQITMHTRCLLCDHQAIYFLIQILHLNCQCCNYVDIINMSSLVRFCFGAIPLIAIYCHFLKQFCRSFRHLGIQCLSSCCINHLSDCLIEASVENLHLQPNRQSMMWAFSQ